MQYVLQIEIYFLRSASRTFVKNWSTGAFVTSTLSLAVNTPTTEQDGKLLQ